MILIAVFAGFPEPPVVCSLNLAHSKITLLPDGKSHRIEVENPNIIERLKLPGIFKEWGAVEIYTSEIVTIACRLPTAKEAVLVSS